MTTMPETITPARDAAAAPQRRRAPRFPLEYALPFAVMAVLFIALAGYQAYVSRESARDASAADVRNLALVLESKLDNDFSTAARAVAKMVVEIEPEAMRLENVPRYKARVSARLKTLASDIPIASALRLFDAGGNRLYTSVDNEFEFNIADRRFFRQVREDRTNTTVYTEVLTGRYSGRATMFVVKAVRDAKGRFLGSVNAAMDLSALYQYFRGIELGANGMVALRRLDSGAMVVRYPGPVEVDNKPEPNLPMRQALVKGARSGVIELVAPVDGVARLYAYRTVGAHPLYVVVGKADTEYLAEWRTNAAALLVASALFVAILAAVFIRLAREEARRNSADAQLRESEQRFRHLIADNNSVILQVDPQGGRILEANAAALRFYGWSHEELCAKTLHQIEVSDSPLVEAEREAASKTRRERGVYSHRTAGGESRTVEVHSTPIAFGERALLVCIVFDITERVRAEDSILELMREQKAILNSGLVGLTKTKQRRYVWVNETFATMLGYTPEELIGQSTLITFSSRAEWELTGAEMYAAVTGGGITRNERQYVRKDGSRSWFAISGGLLYPGSEESIWAFVDIDASKRLEQELRESEARFRHLTEISADWYWEQDENLRFTFVSSGASSQVDAVGSYIGKTRWELPYVDMDPAVIRDNEAAMAARLPFKGLVIKRPGADGGILYAELSGEPIFDEDGRFRGYRGVGREITDRMRSEEAVRAINAVMNSSASARSAILEQALRDAKARS